MKVKSSLCIFATLLFTFTVSDAALSGKYPPVDKPPPPVKEWTDLVDLKKVPNAPIVKTVGNCPAKDTFCNWSCTGCSRPESDIIKCPKKGDWGLSFDDGPTEFTVELLKFLKTKNAKVTFFVVGSRVFQNPEILKQAVDDGHQIGVHTWSHTALTTQSDEEIIAEIKWTESAIKDAVGLTPKYMRPPFGDYDDRVRGIATQLGYKIVIWDLDTNDWMSADDPNFDLTWIEGNFTQWVKMPSSTGHISLEHDLYKQTAERAQLAVPIVQGAGFTIKTVASCVGDSHPYLEDTPAGGDNSTTPAASASADPTSSSDPYSTPDSSSAADPAASSTSGGGGYGYLDGGSATATAASSSSSSSTSAMASGTPNGASLNNNNLSLLSGVLFIVGTLMFV